MKAHLSNFVVAGNKSDAVTFSVLTTYTEMAFEVLDHHNEVATGAHGCLVRVWTGHVGVALDSSVCTCS